MNRDEPATLGKIMNERDEALREVEALRAENNRLVNELKGRTTRAQNEDLARQYLQAKAEAHDYDSRWRSAEALCVTLKAELARATAERDDIEIERIHARAELADAEHGYATIQAELARALERENGR